jgi:hypothetical protein
MQSSAMAMTVARKLYTLKHPWRRFFRAFPRIEDGPLLLCFPLAAEQLDRVHKVVISVTNMAMLSIEPDLRSIRRLLTGTSGSPRHSQDRQGDPESATRVHGCVSRQLNEDLLIHDYRCEGQALTEADSP